MNNCLGVFYFKDTLPWDLWSCKKKYLLAYKSENIAPAPWALGNGGENRNWKCPGCTELCSRNPWGRNDFRTPFPRTKSGLALFGVKLIGEEILRGDFHLCVWLGNWESCCFPWGKSWVFYSLHPWQLIPNPEDPPVRDPGSPFWVLFPWK